MPWTNRQIPHPRQLQSLREENGIGERNSSGLSSSSGQRAETEPSELGVVSEGEKAYRQDSEAYSDDDDEERDEVDAGFHQMSFCDIDLKEAVEFVFSGPHRLLKFYRSGCLAFTHQKTEHNFWVDQKIMALRWDSNKKDTSRADQTPRGKVFLSDIYHIQPYMLDAPATPTDRHSFRISKMSNSASQVKPPRPVSTSWMSKMAPRMPLRMNTHMSLETSAKMTPLLSHAPEWLLGIGLQLDFDIIFKDDENRQRKIKLRAPNRKELKHWVTGLEHLVHHRSQTTNWMNIDAMSRTMFHKADVNENGSLDKDECKMLLLTVGKLAKDRMGIHFEALFKKFDKDGSGSLDEDEFTALFQSFMVKSSLREYFCRYIGEGEGTLSGSVRETGASKMDFGLDSTLRRPTTTSTTSRGELSVVGELSEVSASRHTLPMTTKQRLRTQASNASFVSLVSQGSMPTRANSADSQASSPLRRARRELLTYKMLCNFLKEVQNEVDATDDSAKKVIESVRQVPGAQRAVHPRLSALTEVGFSILMCSNANLLIDPVKTPVYQDMNLPLTHYWINTSHNTYLEGKQIGGVASVAQYLEVLRQGCRCIEIDIWDGSDGQPVVTHRYTSTPWIKFEDVIRACCDFGFAYSEFPLIISLEQHCCDEQKVKCGSVMNDFLGDNILRIPPEGIGEAELVTPQQSQRKFIVKGKLVKIEADSDEDCSEDEDDVEQEQYSSEDGLGELVFKGSGSSMAESEDEGIPSMRFAGSESMLDLTVASPDGKTKDSLTSNKKPWKLKVPFKSRLVTGAQALGKAKESREEKKKMKKGMSGSTPNLLRKGLMEYNRCIYLVQKKFEPGQVLEHGSRLPCNVASFKDKKMRECSRRFGPLMNAYHEDSLSRIYPGLGSSNPLPQTHWIHGAQMVALNFQNRDEAMLLNAGMFQHWNGGCGYIRKSREVEGAFCLCKKGHRMVWVRDEETIWSCQNSEQDCRCRFGKDSDESLSLGVPRFTCIECDEDMCTVCANTPVPMSEGLTLRLRVVSAHFLPNPQSRQLTSQKSGDLSLCPFVRVKIHGIKEDTAQMDTEPQPDNGFDPRWDEVFEFPIQRPDVAVLSIQVLDSFYKQAFIAASAYPVEMLREGLRWVPLWDLSHRTIENCGILADIRVGALQLPPEVAPAATLRTINSTAGSSINPPRTPHLASRLSARLSQTDLLGVVDVTKGLRNSITKGTQEVAQLTSSMTKGLRSSFNAGSLKESLSNIFHLPGLRHVSTAPRGGILEETDREVEITSGMPGNCDPTGAWPMTPMSQDGTPRRSRGASEARSSASSNRSSGRLPLLTLDSAELGPLLEQAEAQGCASKAKRSPRSEAISCKLVEPDVDALARAESISSAFKELSDLPEAQRAQALGQHPAEDTDADAPPFSVSWHASVQPEQIEGLFLTDNRCCQRNSDSKSWCCASESSQIGARQ